MLLQIRARVNRETIKNTKKLKDVNPIVDSIQQGSILINLLLCLANFSLNVLASYLKARFMKDKMTKDIVKEINFEHVYSDGITKINIYIEKHNR